MSLERGPLSLVSTTEELLESKSSGFGLENQGYGRRWSAMLTTRHPVSAELGTDFTAERLLVSRYSLPAD
jgi:hypothetical protein